MSTISREGPNDHGCVTIGRQLVDSFLRELFLQVSHYLKCYAYEQLWKLTNIAFPAFKLMTHLHILPGRSSFRPTNMLGVLPPVPSLPTYFTSPVTFIFSSPKTGQTKTVKLRDILRINSLSLLSVKLAISSQRTLCTFRRPMTQNVVMWFCCKTFPNHVNWKCRKHFRKRGQAIKKYKSVGGKLCIALIANWILTRLSLLIWKTTWKGNMMWP